MPIGDLTTIFETIGEDAAARGASKVATEVDHVRTNFSKGMETLGKVQGRIMLLSNTMAAFGLGGLTAQQFKQEGIKRSGLGDAAVGIAEIGLTIGGALAGSFIGSVVPIIGPIIGSVLGGIAGGLVTSVIEPAIQRMAQSFRSIEDRVNDFLLQAKNQIDALDKSQDAITDEIKLASETFGHLYRRILTNNESFKEDIAQRFNNTHEQTKNRLQEFSKIIQASLMSEYMKLGNVKGTGRVVSDTRRSITLSEINKRQLDERFNNEETDVIEKRINVQDVAKDAAENIYQRGSKMLENFTQQQEKLWKRALRN